MEKIKEIEVSGRIYGAGEKLEIFALNSHNNQTVSWCTIYGKNGSGKTTLSKALWNYSHPDDESLETDSPQTSFNLESNISPENCYVFNEDFINRRVKKIENNLDLLNNKINNRNKQIDKHAQEASLLEQMINTISLSENKNLYYSYNKVIANYNKKKEELEQRKNELNDIQKKLNEAKDELRRTNIQMDHLNSALSLIFLSPNRLSLEGTPNGEYGIYVRGKRVSLSNLSAGEKNAIALSYFFSMPYENRSEEYFSKNDSLFVLDDPVSSLDRNNEIGIYSLIEHEISEIKKLTNTNNNFVQVIALTHSLPVYYALKKLLTMSSKRKKANRRRLPVKC